MQSLSTLQDPGMWNEFWVVKNWNMSFNRQKIYRVGVPYITWWILFVYRSTQSEVFSVAYWISSRLCNQVSWVRFQMGYLGFRTFVPYPSFSIANLGYTSPFKMRLALVRKNLAKLGSGKILMSPLCELFGAHLRTSSVYP